jgi:3-oxoacid CoA-transferase subunit A
VQLLFFKQTLERGWPWFADEQPDEVTKQAVETRLEQLSWKIDVVLTHTCPLKYEPTEVFLPFIDQSSVDKSNEEWLDRVESHLTYRKWYCGHYHTEKRVDKLEFLFESMKAFCK